MKKESFLIHTEYIDDLPEENKSEFLLYIFNYGSKGEEPKLEGLALTIWKKIKRRMDAEAEAYNGRLTGNARGGAKHRGNQYTNKNGSQLPKLPIGEEKENKNGSHGSDTDIEFVNEFESDNVNTQTENVCEEPHDQGLAQKKLFELVQAHNASAPQDRKVPVSKNFLSFLQKEMREFYDEVGTKEKPEDIIQAFKNFLQIANSDTWQKSFSWRTFIRNYQNFTPDFFALDRYVNTDADTNDATKRPENVFYFKHKDDPRFIFRAFRDYQDEWAKAGRPDGEAYYKLQDEWIRKGPPAGSFYTSYEKEA